MNEHVEGDEGSRRDHAEATWRKARLPSLTPAMTAEEALTDIVQGCVEHLRGNEQCLLGRTHKEGVHQMRVAVRRLRSSLALYHRVIPVEQSTHITGELKWLIRELGPARDWDVFTAEILAPVVRQMSGEDRLETLADTVGRQRDAAYARAQEAVGSQRYLGLVLLLDSWAEGRGWRDAKAADASVTLQANAQTVAHELLHGIYEHLLATGAGFEHLVSEERHKVRIQLKKLRYATEFFASLYAKRRVTPYLAAMRSLQDALGVSNDVDVARKLLKQVVKPARGKERGRLAYAAGLVVGWHSHVGDGREQELINAWSAFSARPPYWETRTAVPSAKAVVENADPAPGRTPVPAVTAVPDVPAEEAGAAANDTAPGMTAPPAGPPAAARRRRVARRV